MLPGPLIARTRGSGGPHRAGAADDTGEISGNRRGEVDTAVFRVLYTIRSSHFSRIILSGQRLKEREV